MELENIKHFYREKPCKKCGQHIYYRSTKRCVTCRSATNRNRYQTMLNHVNPEQVHPDIIAEIERLRAEVATLRSEVK